jgi:hypothetical protein
MRTCRFCAEEIQDAAIVCKHCGRHTSGAPPVVRVDQNWGGLVLWGTGIAVTLILLATFCGPAR